jgi:hypothetical protein
MSGLHAASIMHEIVLRDDKSTFALTQFYYLARRFSATEPRDRIFALLELLTLGRSDTAIPELLLPNYEKPVLQVFRDATRFALTEEIEGEEILGHICHRSHEDMTAGGKPSWSFNWDRQFDAEQDSSVFTSQSKAGIPLNANEDATSALVIANAIDMDVLTLNGFNVATITWLTTPMTESIMSEYTNVRMLTETLLGASQRSLVSVSHPDSNIYSLTADLMTAGSLHSGRSDFFDDSQQKTMAFKDFLHQIRYSSSLPYITLSHHDDSDPIMASSSKFYQRFRAKAHQRCFFLTSTGHLGIGPKITHQGDVVVVFKGATYPFVLRPMQDEYQLIGAAYVHGLMEGEVFAMGLQSAWFDIR